MPRKQRAAAATATKPQALPIARRKVAAVDFYAALQRALDGAQRQLSRADNGFVDFVVKELKVDAAVRLQISALGVLQFELADETTSAESVSRVSLTLAAVAKSGSDGNRLDWGRTDVTPLSDLRWLPPEFVAQLATHEVRTVAEYLGLVADARVSARIEPLLRVRSADVQRWGERMRLLMLPDMTATYVEVLGKVGVDSIGDLAVLSDDALVQLQKKTSADVPPELLAQWRDASLPRPVMPPVD